MKCCLDILKKKILLRLYVSDQFTKDGFMGNITCNGKFGTRMRARTQANVFQERVQNITRSISHCRKSQCNTSTNVSGDRCISGRLSSRACFPRACITALSISRITRCRKFNFPDFSTKKRPDATIPEYDSTAVYKTKRRNSGRNQTFFFVVP